MQNTNDTTTTTCSNCGEKISRNAGPVSENVGNLGWSSALGSPWASALCLDGINLHRPATV